MTLLEDLPCRELIQLVTEYLEGTLDPHLRRRFDAHLATCPGCQTYLEQLHETIRLCGQLHREDVDPAVLAELTRTFRGWRRGTAGDALDPRGD